MNNYLNIKFVGGVCALIGGGIGIALGINGESVYLILGVLSFLTGVGLFYGMSKR